MSSLTIQQKYEKLLLDYAHRHMPNDSRLRRCPLDRNSAVAGYPAAWLATHPVGGDESFVGSKELLRFATECGDVFYRDWHGRNKTTLPNEHFSTTFYVDLFGVMEERLDGRRRQHWRQCLASHCESLAEALHKKLSADRTKHTALEVGCGPNHLYCWAAMLYKGGVVLDHPAWRRRATWAIHKLMTAQDEQGYHPEHIGPVLQYHVVTLSGLSTYYRLSHDEACIESLRKGADFWCNMIYPDLSPIETFDERNRWSPNYAISAHGALQMTPMGRRYINLALDRMLEGEPPPKKLRHRHRHSSHVGWVLRHILYYQDGPRKALPIERDPMLFRLDRDGLVRRTGPWVYALSAFCNEPWETNPFILDRTQNLSVWHQKAGLILGGGNDKHAPEVATIYALEGGFVGYYRPRSGNILAHKSGDRMELDYGPIIASIGVRPINDRTLRLAATLKHWVLNLKPQLNLQLQLAPGETVRMKGAKAMRLGKSAAMPRILKTGGELSTGRWTLKGPSHMTLLWPHMPYNSYRIERHTEIEAAVGIATIPFTDDCGKLELELHVGGGAKVGSRRRP